jgi:hypothetical protein
VLATVWVSVRAWQGSRMARSLLWVSVRAWQGAVLERFAAIGAGPISC